MKIKMSLNPESIDDAIKQLQAYRDDLPKKSEQIRIKVTEQLRKLVQDGFDGAFYDGLLYEGWQVPSVTVRSKDGDTFSVVIAQGTEAVFIEFGAGVYYNPGGGPSDRPPGIVKIGEYGKGYGKREIWGYYEEPGNKDSLKLTHGTPASRPMFYALKAIAEQIPSIAREVFNGG